MVSEMGLDYESVLREIKQDEELAAEHLYRVPVAVARRLIDNLCFINQAEEKGCELSELTVDDLSKLHPSFEKYVDQVRRGRGL